MMNVKASTVFFHHVFSARRRRYIYIYFFFLYIRKENNNNNNRRRTPRKTWWKSVVENMGENIWRKDFIFRLALPKDFEINGRGVLFLPLPPY
jgi:hypothetical protein